MVIGGTGFIGRRLVLALERPVVLTRDPARARQLLGPSVDPVGWDPRAGAPPSEYFRNSEVVFHLAGESIAGGRWNQRRKRLMRDSRVVGTRRLVDALENCAARPAVLVSASAVGFYGDRGDEVLDESSSPGNGFLAEVCREWEAEAARARSFGMRVVQARTGVVLDRSGGALARMLPPFRFGLGGRLGSGRQWMPWIHLDDLVGLLLHAARSSDISGPMNAVAPKPATNTEFTRALASALGRPAVFPVPEFALKLLFGEMASILLGSQRALPRVAEKTGYRFEYPALEPALRSAVGRNA